MGKPSDIPLSLTDVWRAWRRFRAGKKSSLAILEFERHLPENILRLCADLNTDMYSHGNYDHKIVNEKKRRDIAVAGVRDRIVHRLLYDYLVAICDKHFDSDVWSCRVGKGTVAALKRSEHLLKTYSDSYIWRADVAKFFDHVDHEVLLSTLHRYEIGDKAQKLLDKVIHSYTIITDRGLPIGNLTSQILANIYLHEFDFFVRQTLKPLAYIRYGDDFLLFAPNKHQAELSRILSTEFLANKLHLSVHTKNNVIIRPYFGVRYLGVTLYPSSKTLKTADFHRILKNTNKDNLQSYQNYIERYCDKKQMTIFMAKKAAIICRENTVDTV